MSENDRKVMIDFKAISMERWNEVQSEIRAVDDVIDLSKSLTEIEKDVEQALEERNMGDLEIDAVYRQEAE